jgi:hypothetical protein
MVEKNVFNAGMVTSSGAMRRFQVPGWRTTEGCSSISME